MFNDKGNKGLSPDTLTPAARNLWWEMVAGNLEGQRWDLPSSKAPLHLEQGAAVFAFPPHLLLLSPFLAPAHLTGLRTSEHPRGRPGPLLGNVLSHLDTRTPLFLSHPIHQQVLPSKYVPRTWPLPPPLLMSPCFKPSPLTDSAVTS